MSTQPHNSITRNKIGWLLHALENIDKNDPINFKSGESIVHLCARDGNQNMMGCYLNLSYNVDSCDIHNQTPLFYAISNGHLAICKMLIAKGANVNHQDENLNTPLIKAILNNKFNIMKLLIASGADVNKNNKYEDTALKIACEKGNTLVAKFLIDNGAEHFDPRNN